MRAMPRAFYSALLLIVMGTSSTTNAKVSAVDAKALETELTPVGAERAGNADGTIPSWTGGIIEPPPGYTKGGNYIDPFADDAILFTIDSTNYKKYQDKLSAGNIALLQKYPDTYKIPVYPTRRSASYPKEIYEALAYNAVNAEMRERHAGVENAIITSAFPIASKPEEMLWNHILRYRGQKLRYKAGTTVPTTSGDYTLSVNERSIFLIHAQPELDSRKLENKLVYIKTKTLAPPKQAGSINLMHESMDQVSSPRKAWQYVAGQRRLRRAPSFSYDSDLPQSDGFRTTDQFDMFNGAPDQYEWKLLGKREIYIPYNSYKLDDRSLNVKDIIKPKHINQDHTRYELHRVWVVEGKLRVGISHVYAKRVIYIDEDSWQVALTEEYDKQLNLWRVQEGHAMNYYDQPLVWYALETSYDLKSGRYYADGLDNEFEAVEFNAEFSSRDFSTSAVRREAKR